MDFEMRAWEKRKSEEAPQSQGRRAVRQAVAEGGSELEVLRRLVDVLATLSLVNAAELRDLTCTVFKTYLVPSSENVTEAMAEAGRLYHDSAGAIKNKNEAERADAQEQLGPPFVYVWVAFLRSLASTKELGAEHVAVLRQYWENSVLKSAPVQLVSHVRYCRAKPCRNVEGKEGWTCIVFCLDPITLTLEGALEAALRLQKGVRKFGPAPRGPLEREAARLPDADAREIKRLARRVEQHSQRMAELLRRGVLEPSLAYAFLMTKGGQRIPQAKSKAKARASSRATTSEGAEAALTRHRHVSRQKDSPWCSRGTGGAHFATSLTPYLPLDTVAWPLRKDDSQDLSWVVFFFFERYRGMACARMTRTNLVVFFFLVKNSWLLAQG